MTDMRVFEAIHSQRAIRNFKQDPVPDEDLNTILEAATKAPNGGNRQRWRFVVIRDRETKRLIGEWYRDTLGKNIAGYDSEDAIPRVHKEAYQSMVTQHMEDIPVLIMVCQFRGGTSPTIPRNIFAGSGAGSIYPAVQNLMLAARALGLGAVLTNQHIGHEEEVKELLGIPDDVDTAALIPLGYPAEGEHFGGSRRRPVSEVTFYERWGQGASPQEVNP